MKSKTKTTVLPRGFENSIRFNLVSACSTLHDAKTSFDAVQRSDLIRASQRVTARLKRQISRSVVKNNALMSRSPLSPTLFPAGARELPQAAMCVFLGEPLTHPFPLPFFPSYARFACVDVGKMRLPHPELRSPSSRARMRYRTFYGVSVFGTLAQPLRSGFWRSLGREPAILSECDKSRQLSISMF